MEQVERLLAAHEELKRRIHGFRAPIKSRAGLFAVGCAYVGVPLLVGYGLFTWTEGVRDANLGVRREKLLAAAEARRRAAAAAAAAPVRAGAPPAAAAAAAAAARAAVPQARGEL